MDLLAICLALLLIGRGCALPPLPPGRTYDFEASYIVDFGTDDEGGCQSYHDQINTAYNEALDIIQGSLDVLNDLQQPIPASRASAESNEWRRKVDGFFALFGATLPGNGWQPTDDKTKPDWVAFMVQRELHFHSKQIAQKMDH
jgi:hypothetical protein